jgi:uncharacterized membrane protein YedE/YeeE
MGDMKNIKFLFVGIVFGILFTKTEIISWFRIYEMFRFESFHMYGVIGSAVVIGIIGTQVIKRYKLTDIEGHLMEFPEKEKNYKSALFGGIIFGLGWALTGACPGPMYTLVGAGFPVYLIIIGAALLGTFFYGLIRDKLPHK